MLQSAVQMYTIILISSADNLSTFIVFSKLTIISAKENDASCGLGHSGEDSGGLKTSFQVVFYFRKLQEMNSFVKRHN